jgi:hypothetical protein
MCIQQESIQGIYVSVIRCWKFVFVCFDWELYFTGDYQFVAIPAGVRLLMCMLLNDRESNFRIYSEHKHIGYLFVFSF